MNFLIQGRIDSYFFLTLHREMYFLLCNYIVFVVVLRRRGMQ